MFLRTFYTRKKFTRLSSIGLKKDRLTLPLNTKFKIIVYQLTHKAYFTHTKTFPKLTMARPLWPCCSIHLPRLFNNLIKRFHLIRTLNLSHYHYSKYYLANLLKSCGHYKLKTSNYSKSQLLNIKTLFWREITVLKRRYYR